MKKKIFSLLVLVMTAMTASAYGDPTYNLTKAEGAEAHGTIQFYVGETEVSVAAEGQTVTVKITPETGWIVGTPSGEWGAVIASARGQRREPEAETPDVPVLKDIELTPVEGEDNQWTFEMQRADAEIGTTYRKLLSHLDIVVGEIDAVTYDGKEQKPEVSVKDGDKTLVKGTDYTVEYEDNTNAGTATVAFTGIGGYAGGVLKMFAINQKELEASMIAAVASQTYTGEEITPEPAVTYEGMTLVKNEDFTYSYQNNIDARKADADVNAPTVTINAIANGNYKGSASVTFTIQEAAVALTDPTAKTGLVYNAEAQELVTAGEAEGGEMQYSLDGETYSTTLPTGTDAKEYTVYYKVVGDANHNDVEAKTLKVTIGQAELTAVTLKETNLVYNQEEQNAEVATVSAGELEVPADGYDVTGNKGTNVGNYTAKVTGKGNFKGEIEAQWSIVSADAQLFDIEIGTTDYTYDGTEKVPEVTVKYGSAVLTPWDEEEQAGDYTVAYAHNVDAGTATVTVTGKGYYSGTQTAQFTIGKAALTVTAADVTVIYANEPVFTVSYEGFVNDEDETVLSGTLAFDCDYTKESPVGSTHAVTPKDLTSQNYEITFVPGTLTVAMDPASVAVMEKISAIGKVEYTPESKAKIDDARNAYKALTKAQKTLVDNYDVLTAAEARYAQLKADNEAAAAVIKKIKAIGEVELTDKCKAKIDAAREAYDALTVMQKVLVTNLATLIASESKYERLKENKAAADAVMEKIAAIGEVEYTPESKAKIDAAREAYDALLPLQKELVTNYKTLTAAETTYAGMASDDEAAAAVTKKIDAIGEVGYTPESKALIDAARKTYNALTDAQKALVENYDVLTAAETTYANLKADHDASDAVIKKIDAIGKVEYKTICWWHINTAREAYDALTDAQKALVTNYGTLTDAEARYAELEALATGVDTSLVNSKEMNSGKWYDLKGRKLNGKPTRKGTYILNGKKVVIK